MSCEPSADRGTAVSDIQAAGGLCAPIHDAYGLDKLGSTGRPVRDALAEMMRVSQMSNLERHIYKLNKGMSVSWGVPSVAALVAETDWDGDNYDSEIDEVDGHEWDEPIRLAWSGMHAFRMRNRS